MATFMKLTLNLFLEESRALETMAQFERRSPEEQAAWIIRIELQRRGFLENENQKINKVETKSTGNASQKPAEVKTHNDPSRPIQKYVEPLLRATDVAKRLGVSRSAAYQLMATSLPIVRFGAGILRVRESDLERYILEKVDRHEP